ncbi:MAG: hypothetical protein RLZ98_819 [Pseudomonadota bacterium]|jgi:hypothetical protein
MKKAIFVSYRRGDSAGYTGWLCDQLMQHWSREQIFMDIDGIGPGENFPEKISAAVETCDVLLSVIGKSWLTAADANGRPRLGRSNDFVSLEIAAALEGNKLVIPVLVDGASMPDEEELPDRLKALAFRSAVSLRHETFRRDAQDLINTLKKFVAPSGPPAISPLSPERASSTSAPLPHTLEIDTSSSTNPQRRSTTLADVAANLPPIIYTNDPQRERFGGQAERNQRKLIASVRPTKKNWCAVTISVIPTSPANPLSGESVYFFVHDSFSPNQFQVRIDGQGEAVLRLVSWGAFTVGAVADEGNTSLELDLADPDAVEAPAEWQER